jgi:hypothetical protein
MRVYEAFGSPLAHVLSDLEEGRKPDPEKLADALCSGHSLPKIVLDYAADLIDPRVKDKGGRPAREYSGLMDAFCSEISALLNDPGKPLTFDEALSRASRMFGVPKSRLRKFFYEQYLHRRASDAIKNLVEEGMAHADAVSLTAKWLGVRPQTLRKRLDNEATINAFSRSPIPKT